MIWAGGRGAENFTASGGFDVVGKLPVIKSDSPGTTERIGEILARAVFPGLLVLLCGDLGAGKTLLARSFGATLGAGVMRSPTFNIEIIYRLPEKNFSLIHSDLYRLASLPESSGRAKNSDGSDIFMHLEELIEDGDVVLAEWGDLWTEPPTADRWDVNISLLGENARGLELSAFGTQALAALSDAYAEILDLAAPGVETRPQ
jgi:tRNA threonylcarbamoyladenosine biosynthesis protein TsaE